MSQDPHQPHSGDGDYPYGEQDNAGNPYSANPANSQGPYENADNPYGASEYPYGGSSIESPEGTAEANGSGGEQFFYGANTTYNNSSNNNPQEGTSLPLGEAIRQLPQQYLRILTKPSATTFAVEKRKASWDILWVQLIIYAVLEAIIGYLATLINPIQLPPTLAKTGITMGTYQTLMVGISIGQIFLIPLFFFIGVGIIHLIAKAFKGQGSFLEYSYGILLFSLPLSILGNLFRLIPVAGPTLYLVIISLAGIYEIVLYIFATMAVHRLSGGKATAVILIPLGVVMLLSCALFFLVVIVAVGAAGRAG